MSRLIPLLLILLLNPAHSAERPNIVMLLADDLGFRDIGCYDGPVKTPNIDRLAAGGAKFPAFYAGAAVCSPSRATMLTGRHHIRAGVYSWIHDPTQKSHLLERETTLAEILKAQGYATAHIGKWHLGLPTKQFPDKPTPDKHGFDYWFGTWNNAEPSHHNPVNFIRNGKPVGKIEGYSCQIVADEAIGWMKKTKPNKPFYLNVWFHEPHMKTAAPSELVADYGEERQQGAIYSATIDNTDRAIGRIVSYLEETGQLDNTLIIYSSDNGSYLADRCRPLRGQKGVNWEGGLRVPGIFHWPGHISPGTEPTEAAGLVDVVPTVCSLLEIPPSAQPLDGSDLSPILLGKSPEDFKRKQALFWHLQRSRPIVAMRKGDYILTADPAYELSEENTFQEQWIPAVKTGQYDNYQLFDLSKDPGQKTNLAADQAELLESLKKELLQINDSVMADGADWHLRK